MEKYSIEEFSKIVLFAGESVNVEEDIRSKKGVFSIFRLSDEVSDIANLSFSKLKLEADDLSMAEVNQLKEMFKEKVNIKDKELETKIENCTDFVSRVVVYAERVYKYVALDGKAFFDEGVMLIAEAKTLFSNVKTEVKNA